MKNLLTFKKDANKGITLIALIITIVVLLILAGITIGMLDGENGIIGQAQDAKTGTEIDNEKEILDLSIIKAMRKDRYGNITKINLQNELDKNLGEGKTNITEDEQNLFVNFIESERLYQVDKDGNLEYLGTQEELLEKVIITADRESNTTPEFVQNVKLTVKTYLPVENNSIALLYAWTTSNTEEPTEEEYIVAQLEGTKTNRISIISSTVTTAGNYYLWVKAILNEKETPETYGTYAIREYTTLKVCSSESKATSPFLGSNVVNANITRNAIRSITIEDSLEGYSTSNANCWDVSEKGDESILASYTEIEIDGNTYYDIKIASEGKVAANPKSNYLFSYIGYGVSDEVTITGLENLYTAFSTSMFCMFARCKVQNLDVSNFNTSNVTDMRAMFQGCKSLTSLDLSNFDTSKITSMNYMFYECDSLINLNISNFNTKNVTNMSYLFWCNSLTSLDVSNFNTNNVTTMYRMFYKCKNLKTLDVSGFDTTNVTSIAEMFSECSSLATLDVSNFKTSKVESMNGIFAGCGSLISINLSDLNTSNVESMGTMFSGCSSLTSLDIKHFNTSNVTNMQGMFGGCAGLTSLDLSNFNTSKVKNMRNMFNGCSGLTILDLSNFNTSEVTDMGNMFRYCSNLTMLDISNFDVSKATTNDGIFDYFPKTAHIYVGTEDMQNWVLEKTGRDSTEYILIKGATEE